MMGQYKLTPMSPEDGIDWLEYDEGNWERRGDDVRSLIFDIAGVSENIAADVANFLSVQYGHQAVSGEATEDPYGIEARYEEKDPDDEQFQDNWDEFRKEILSRARYFQNGSRSEAGRHIPRFEEPQNYWWKVGYPRISSGRSRELFLEG